MVNKVTLIGNLGRDPELRRLPNGAAVAKFSVATSERYKDREGNWHEQTEWHEVVVWRQLAERAEQRLRKGMQVYVEGKLSTRTWQDKDGGTRKTTEIVGSTLHVLNKREEANTPPGTPPSPDVAAKPTGPVFADTGSAPVTNTDNATDESALPF